MKEYKASKTANFIDWVIGFLLTVFMGYLFALITKQDIWSGIIKFVLLGIIMDFVVLRKHFKRQIILKPHTIEFKSYHIDNAYRDAEIDFSSVTRIGKCFSFNIKGSALSIRTTAHKKDILVDATMKDHKELFSEICKKAREHNPDVKISKKITEYLSE
ncbi:MAG: hypothetical protein IKL16_06030 [Clostridia bacterium]|nr:hypothetical protein [Clostridia bacterium]